MTHSPNLAVLMARYRSLHKQHLEVDAELKAVERQILATERAAEPAPKQLPLPQAKAPKPKASKRGISASTREMVRATVTAIREAGSGEPILRRDLAQRLNLSDYAATHRLRRLRKMGFVERVAGDRYRVVDIVPEL